jgi:hypothetical protein
MVIDKAGLRLKDIYFDSTEDQFTWSERYSNNIAMNQVTGSPIQTILRKLFSKYRKRAIELNKESKGDQAVFYITTNDNDN